MGPMLAPWTLLSGRMAMPMEGHTVGQMKLFDRMTLLVKLPHVFTHLNIQLNIPQMPHAPKKNLWDALHVYVQ